MPTLVFSDINILRLVLSSGCVPAGLSRRPAQAEIDPRGRIWLELDLPLTREFAHALGRFGVQVLGQAGIELTLAVDSWHQLLPLVPTEPTAANTQTVLFEVPILSFREFVGELARLSPNLLQWCWSHSPSVGDCMMLRVVDPPTYSLLAALACTQPQAHAYYEQTRDVWVQVGWRHVLAEQLDVPEGEMLLLRQPRIWEYRLCPNFVTSPSEFPLLRPQASAQPLPVSELSRRGPELPLQLRPTRKWTDQPAEVWICHGINQQQIRALANELPSQIISGLQLAQLQSGQQSLTVLRWSGSGPPVVLMARGWQEFVPYLRLMGLYVPKGFGLFPLIRRDRLRELFALSTQSITWLMPDDASGSGSFRQVHVGLDRFVKLSDYLHYTCPATRALTVQSIEPLATIEVFSQREELMIRSRPSVVEEQSDQQPTQTSRLTWWQRLAKWWKGSKSTPQPRENVSGRSEYFELTRSTTVAPSPAVNPTGVNEPPDLRAEWLERRNTLEARFNDPANPPSSVQRAELWPELATVYIGLNNLADARLCWVNSLWEQDKPMVAWAWNWLRCESAGLPATSPEHRLTTWLDSEPTPQVVRSIAAHIVWLSLHENPTIAATTELTAVFGRVQALLETHEAKLPVRVAWLAQRALAHLAHGDALALARTRDRLLQRLHERGLSMDLDIPSFLRFVGHGAPDRFQVVRDWLIRSRSLVHGWIARLADAADHSSDNALGTYGLRLERQRTQAYADLMLAWGLARLGEDQIAQQWSAEICAIETADPVQRLLLDLFLYRIEEARSDRTSSGALPVELLERIDRLRELERYAVNRLREHSRVLEPREQINAFFSITHSPSFSETLDARLWALHSINNLSQLLAEVERLLSRASKPAEQIAVTVGLLAVCPRLNETLTLWLLEQADRIISQTPDPATHAQLLERGIFAALHYNLSAKVQQLVGRFANLLAGQSGAQIRQWFTEAGNELRHRRIFLHLISQSFRGLRRLGLQSEGERLMTLLAEWVARAERESERVRQRPLGTLLLETLLHLAGGWFYLGRTSQAEAIVDRARQLLYATDSELLPIERTTLARTYAACLGHAPVRYAIGRLEELYARLDRLHLTGSTNNHYTLAVLDLVDTIVLSVVREDFSLGPSVRRWLDDDEYQVRRRMQQDLQAMLNQPSQPG